MDAHEGFPTALAYADFIRLSLSNKIDAHHRANFGQFMTELSVAQLMASMFSMGNDSMRLLDAGAGVGSLTAAFVDRVCSLASKPKSLSVTAFEIDPFLRPYLTATLDFCAKQCEAANVAFSWEVVPEDFIEIGVSAISGDLLAQRQIGAFHAAITNPPYRKIHSNSSTRKHLRSIGLETSNLYTGFLSVATGLLETGGELVAITPRSFCNGPYFRPFRQSFLQHMTFQRIHMFESRASAFRDDDVLQENIIYHALKQRTPKRATITISTSHGPQESGMISNRVDYEEVVHPQDPDLFIRIIKDEFDQQVVQRMAAFHTTLADLEVSVSTGRVVDFRAKQFLHAQPAEGRVPLIYPCHFADGFVHWPHLTTNKPNAIAYCLESENLLVPCGTYVLVKRFSAKEEARRIVAAIYDPDRVGATAVGFENHLNYFHAKGAGLPKELALGLAAFLNSTLVDAFFRQFNGHTQVNATDLRKLKYPSRTQLEALGARLGDRMAAQEELDQLLEEQTQCKSSLVG